MKLRSDSTWEGDYYEIRKNYLVHAHPATGCIRGGYTRTSRSMEQENNRYLQPSHGSYRQYDSCRWKICLQIARFECQSAHCADLERRRNKTVDHDPRHSKQSAEANRRDDH